MDIDRNTAERIEARLARIERTVEALGRILIRRRTAADRGVSADTIDHNTKIGKFKEVGHKRTFVEIGEVGVIPQRKRIRRTNNK